MYYLSLVFSIPCLILTWIMTFINEESRFFRYFDIPKAIFCLFMAFFFMVLGIIKDTKEFKKIYSL